MQVDVRSPAKKICCGGALLALAAAYLGVTAMHVVAAHEAQFNDGTHLRRAVALDPGNAEYADHLGLYELTANQSPASAITWLDGATALNPHAAHYWMDLALTQQSLGDTASEAISVDHALAADPHNPIVAWNAGNLYFAQGSPDRAMKQFRAVLENDPYLIDQALKSCWRMRPDTDYLLAQVIPPNAYASFLQFLIGRKETAGAAQVWDRIFALDQPLERPFLLDYMRYLILNQEVAQAERVWQQAANLSGLASYQSSAENLLINGDFSLPILNGGFDWIHTNVPGVNLALDTSEPHSSSRSLRITLDGAGIADAGILQVIPVQPNTSYEFSGFYKAQDVDGAGGMEFSITDAYKDTALFMSDNLTNVDFWKETGGTFTTGPSTQLVVLRVTRVPAGSPVRGKLWIDGLRLVQTGKDTLTAEANSQ